MGDRIQLASDDSADARHAMRRLSEASNRLTRADRFLVLKCQGRGCRRRLAQVVVRPGRGTLTPDGRIEPDRFTDGPQLTLFGPLESSTGTVQGEYRLRGRESVAAPGLSISLRGHQVRHDGSIAPEEVPLGPGHEIVVVCSCAHRNIVNLSALSARVELVRHGTDRW